MKWLFVLCATAAFAQAPGSFELLAKYKNLGGLVASAVGPGPTPGSQRFYQSYLYIDNTIDVVAIDPATGKVDVFPNPAPTESGARCMAVGPDGNVYLGTLPGAHLLKLDVKAGKLIDLGRPASTESYIWDINFAPDGKLYGATYPQSKLIRYDPKTGKSEDLGRMDPVEQYAHFVAGSDDGFVYIGIGTSKANIAAYRVSTGEHREIVPAEFQVVGQGNVYRGKDGKVYGTVPGHTFRMDGWTAVPIDAKDAAPSGKDNRAAEAKPVGYEGNWLPLFRIGFAPDGELYGSSILPIDLVKLDRSKHALLDLGRIGGGEVYSFLAHDKRLIMAAYAGDAPLMLFDPAQPFARRKNPELVNFTGSDSGWRPQAMIDGPHGLIYIGAVAGYGKLGGPLSVFDPAARKVEQYHQLITDQSVVTLAAWKDRIVGGTTIGGGGGSHPTQTEAKLFIWDPEKRTKEFETVPVPGEKTINDLIATPDGLVYGVAGSTLFVFDPVSRTVKDRKPLPFSGAIYNGVALGPDGRIWGLTSSGIFAIDRKTHEATLVAKAPEKITGGFALRDGSIYFLSGPAVYRYLISGKPHE